MQTRWWSCETDALRAASNCGFTPLGNSTARIGCSSVQSTVSLLPSLFGTTRTSVEADRHATVILGVPHGLSSFASVTTCKLFGQEVAAPSSIMCDVHPVQNFSPPMQKRVSKTTASACTEGVSTVHAAGVLPSHQHALHSRAAGACPWGDLQECMHAGAQCCASSGASSRPCWTAHLSDAKYLNAWQRCRPC